MWKFAQFKGRITRTVASQCNVCRSFLRGPSKCWSSRIWTVMPTGLGFHLIEPPKYFEACVEFVCIAMVWKQWNIIGWFIYVGRGVLGAAFLGCYRPKFSFPDDQISNCRCLKFLARCCKVRVPEYRYSTFNSSFFCVKIKVETL